jgi:hypothetical protein
VDGEVVVAGEHIVHGTHGRGWLRHPAVP